MKDLIKTTVILVNLLFYTCIYAQGSATPVSVVEVIKAPVFEEIPLTGSVEAKRISKISPKEDGYVAELLVDEGDDVELGQALIRLDPVMAEIMLKRVQAQLKEEMARLKEAERQQAEAAELVKKKHIPATDYEATIADVEISSAAVQRLRAELNRQRETLARHTIYSPLKGVVARKLVEVGQWVENSTALLEIVEIDILRIEIPVPQQYFNVIGQGTPASVRFDAMPNREFPGTVTIIVPVGHESARTFPVKIEMNNANRIIAPGMSARVRIRIKQTGDALLLPRDAVIKKPDGSESAWVIRENGNGLEAKSVSLKTGQAARENLEIISGEIQPGDRVVVRGNEILRPGQAVYIAEELEIEL